MAAKAVGKTYGLPIVQLDIGRIMNKMVGGSESNMRQVLSILDGIGAAVIWLRSYANSSN
jgi:SpoVK/Ycf46/Vps4 family AAA+-type ATPase